MSTTLHKDLTGADLHIAKLHADTHVAAGTDPLVLAESQVTDLTTDLAGKVDEGDARLTDARTPVAHAHSEDQVTDLISDLADKVATGDARLSDARTPTAHTQAESTVTNLVTDLAGKAPIVHSHVKADITDFPAIGAGSVTSVTGTSPIVSSEGTTPAISLPAATNAAPGHATAAQIAALEAATAAQHAIATIGTGNGLSIAGQAISLAPATASVPGAATAAQITKLDGIAAGAKVGDVVGPASAIDGHLAVFDTTTGKLLKDGGAVPAGGGDTVGLQSQLNGVRPFPAPVTTQNVAVPLTIEHTGATEVSAALNAFIATVPDGSIISFPTNAIYKIHESIIFNSRHNLIFDGNGTTLQVDATASGSTPYTSPFFFGDDPAYPNSDIVFHDFILIGNSSTPGVYDADAESQANLQIAYGPRFEIYNITGSAAPGDFIHLEQVDGVWIHDCHALTAGRQGVSVISGSDILIERNAFDVVGWITVDVEPNGSGDACSNVIFRNCTAGTCGYLFFVIYDMAEAIIDNIVASGNTITGGSLTTLVTNGGTVRTTRISFINNRGEVTAAGPICQFLHVDGLTIEGNVQPLTSGVFATFTDCTGIVQPLVITAAGQELINDANAAAQLVTLGLTATAAELNALDGVTSTVTELNYTDGVTSAIQTQFTGKAAASAITNVDNTSDATKDAAAVTVTNHRFTRRVDTQTTTDTITPEISTYDIFIRTAQAHALVINNHSSSTPVDGDMMLFEILSDATVRAITYGNLYVAKAGVALPSATVASKNLTLLFIWRNDLTQWVLLSAGQEA